MADGYDVSMRDDQDLQEEDVWAAVEGREDSGSQEMRRACQESSGRHFHGAAPRVIPRGCHKPALSHQSSAPVKIPDWSKIYGKTAKKGACSDSSGDDHLENFSDYRDSVDAEEEDDDGMVPPHEYIARRLARTQISSFSMCEGIGRTLKGRDLSKVRNAILTKTGFLE